MDFQQAHQAQAVVPPSSTTGREAPVAEACAEPADIEAAVLNPGLLATMQDLCQRENGPVEVRAHEVDIDNLKGREATTEASMEDAMETAYNKRYDKGSNGMTAREEDCKNEATLGQGRGQKRERPNPLPRAKNKGGPPLGSTSGSCAARPLDAVEVAY